MEIDSCCPCGEVDTIWFSDDPKLEVGLWNDEKDEIVIAWDYDGVVRIKDIDNLILALQKAKELWG